MKSEFDLALTQVCNERGLSKEVILEAIKSALISAYKKKAGAPQNVDVILDAKTGGARVFAEREVVEEVVDSQTQVSLREARVVDPRAEIGSMVGIETTPRTFGRIAAQTAKQVILQRIREAERDSLYIEYAGREGELVNGTIRSIDPRTRAVIVQLGKAEALLHRSEQIPNEHYRFNDRIRVYVLQVERTGRGPNIIVSRGHRDMLRRLLELEVPEIFNGIVEIKGIAREPGARSKVAVAALQAGVDPVGSCVGLRGVRIQNIVSELNGEKIDVVAWDPDEKALIANALSPAKATRVFLNQGQKTATVVVPDSQLSLAIGKEGQNARLAAKLTGWRIDIKNATEAEEEIKRLEAEAAAAAALAEERARARAEAQELLRQAEAALLEEEAKPEEEEVPVAEALGSTEPGSEPDQISEPEALQPETVAELELVDQSETVDAVAAPVEPEVAAPTEETPDREGAESVVTMAEKEPVAAPDAPTEVIVPVEVVKETVIVTEGWRPESPEDWARVGDDGPEATEKQKGKKKKKGKKAAPRDSRPVMEPRKRGRRSGRVDWLGDEDGDGDGDEW